MMSKYDAALVFGSKPDTGTWEFPSHVFKSLDAAAGIFKKGGAPYIIVSGKWALSFDKQKIQQPFRECDKMAEYLMQHGIPAEAILKEGESKDSTSNFFYVKRRILQPNHLRRLFVITADFRLERIRYLAAKILGPAYTVGFTTVPSLPGEAYPNEADTFRRTKAFLQQMTDGDDSFLADKFYSAEYYK